MCNSGPNCIRGHRHRRFTGIRIAFPSNSGRYSDIFQAEAFVFIINLAIILVYFQVSEIVGLAATDTPNPEKTVHKECRHVVPLIVRVDIIPVILLIRIIP
ncbi:MAG: hypothetical protein WCF90_11025 [Methanomicrobiales archaeon]